jgi:hypothetical protein
MMNEYDSANNSPQTVSLTGTGKREGQWQVASGKWRASTSVCQYFSESVTDKLKY